jgi:hypothetical protein
MHASVSKLGVMARRVRQFDLRLRRTLNLGADQCLCRTPRQTQHSTRCWLKRQFKTMIHPPIIAPLQNQAMRTWSPSWSTTVLAMSSQS